MKYEIGYFLMHDGSDSTLIGSRHRRIAKWWNPLTWGRRWRENGDCSQKPAAHIEVNNISAYEISWAMRANTPKCSRCNRHKSDNGDICPSCKTDIAVDECEKAASEWEG